MLPADVRSLPRDEELIFVSGAKPIRAKKLKFDQEAVFQARLRPAAMGQDRLTIAHDWTHVRALGFVAPPSKRAKPAMSKPLVDQPDMFAQAAVKTVKASERASAGFRNTDGTPLPHPTAAAPSTLLAEEQPARPRRATRI